MNNHFGCEREGETEQVLQHENSFKVGNPPQRRMESLIKTESSEARSRMGIKEDGANNFVPFSSSPPNSSIPKEDSHHHPSSPTSESVESLTTTLEHNANLILKLSEEISSLKYQLEAEKSFRCKEEDQLCSLIQAVTEAEVELELLGRSSDTYRNVLSNLIKTTCCSGSISNKTSYSTSLTKMIFTVYTNHMKAMEMYESPSYFNTKSPHDDADSDMSPLNDDRFSIRSSLERLDFDDDYVSDDAERCLSALAHTEEDEELDGENEDGKELSRVPTPLRPFSAPSGLEIVPEEEDEEERFEIEMQCQEEEERFENETLEERETYQVSPSQVNEVLESVLERVNDIVQYSPTQDWDPFESNFLKYKKVKPLDNVPKIEVAEGILVELIKSPTSPRSGSVDSAIGSSNVDQCHIQVTTEDTASNSSENSSNYQENVTTTGANESSESGSNEKLRILWDRVDELNEAFKLQSKELSAAIDKVSQLEDKLSRTGNSQHRRGSMNGTENSPNVIEDEIKAWKELVEQQKGVLEKITKELDSTKHELKERNFMIEQLIAEQKETTNPQEKIMPVVGSIVSRGEEVKFSKRNNISEVSSSGTQVIRDDESEITCHHHTAGIGAEDGFQQEVDNRNEWYQVDPDNESAGGVEEKRVDQEIIDWIQENNDDLLREDIDEEEEDVDEENPSSLKQMDLLSFSYLNSPCRRKIEKSGTQKKIHFLDTTANPDSTCDQVSRTLINPLRQETDVRVKDCKDILPSDDRSLHSEHVPNKLECCSPQHLKSKRSFPSRPNHIPPTSYYHDDPPATASTVTENELTVGNYYETSSSAPDDQVTTTTTILGVQELDKEEKYNNIKDDNHYQNDDLTMGKCHKDIVGPTAMETTTLHEYCSQRQKFHGSNAKYNDSYKRFANRIELNMNRVEIIFVPNNNCVTNECTTRKRPKKVGRNNNMENREKRNGTILPFLVLDTEKQRKYQVPSTLPYIY